MPTLETETDYFFIAEGARPLHCEPVIRSLVIPEYLGEWECEVELDTRVGVEEIRLAAEDCSKIAAYIGKHATTLTRYPESKLEWDTLCDAIFWFRRRWHDEDVVTAVELPVGSDNIQRY